MPATSGNNIDNNNLVVLDFTDKDLLHFTKTTFKDKDDWTSIDLRYVLLDTEENNVSSSFYSDTNFSLFNDISFIHNDDSSWYDIYKNSYGDLKNGKYLLTGINISNYDYSSYSSYQRSYEYKDNKYIFNDWSEEQKEQLLEIGPVVWLFSLAKKHNLKLVRLLELYMPVLPGVLHYIYW